MQTNQTSKNGQKKLYLPCIRDKCLLFPACKQKYYIQCNKLSEYYCNLVIIPIDEKRKKILKEFPKLKILEDDKSNESHLM